MAQNVVLLSGGIDSAVTLAEAVAVEEDGGGETVGVHFSYGQLTEEKEIDCARRLTDYYEVDLIEFDLTDVFSEFSEGLTESSTDLSEHIDNEGVATSYVPMRNTVFLSIAAGVAEKKGATSIWYGPNLDDREGYADCRDEYADAMETALSEGTDRADFEVRRPVVEYEKPEIIRRGDQLGVPFEHTWSCYQASDEPCGVCASCEERARGFEEAGVEDPCT
ncbi:MAG: 7-cyano-7-deazaguanine synthase QueC [Halobacteria archaeon]|nr:7-cyano-7-deazaguanine synthase QueC [Halobacteria archaeon]